MQYDKIIIGAGLCGMYAALFCAGKGQKIILLEYDEGPFMRAAYINQARVHMGYHYPRSYSTAAKSAGYFNRFNEDFWFCIYSEFDESCGLFCALENFKNLKLERSENNKRGSLEICRILERK